MLRVSIGIVALMSLFFVPEAIACSNVLVTKSVSADGSNMISYSADSHQLFGELHHLEGGRFKTGTVRQVFDGDSNKFLGEIPQAQFTFTRTGNINEKQLMVGETTFVGREELCAQDGAILDYVSLEYLILERCSTAREAINLIYTLTSEYGYASQGESFSIADKNEVWVMDFIGKGNFGKGIVFVARKVPDGYICAHANQSRITTFPLDKPDECIYSSDVISFARQRGYFNGKDEEFSFADAYNPLDFFGMRACDARVWSAFNILCNGVFSFVGDNGVEETHNAAEYHEYILGHDKSKRLPLFVKPAGKVSVSDVARVMRDHFEGTLLDMTTDIGAGGNRVPYRWRPMTFEWNGKTYCNERAIATQQTGYWLVAQSRPRLPDLIGAVIWFGCDDAATSYLTPIYACVTKTPLCFREGNWDMLTYSPTSAFWMCNRVANACYRAYDQMAPTVRAKAEAWEASCRDRLAVWDAQAQALKTSGKIRKFLTDSCIAAADEIFSQWVQLEEFLLIKYMDGNVKAQNADGSWVTNGNGNIPDKIGRPGYSEKWKEAVVKDHGDVIEVVEPK